MKIKKQSRRDAKQLFRATITNGVMDEARVRDVVKVVLEKRPRGFIAILEHFQRLVKLELDRRRARVDSAVTLSPEQQAEVRSNLERAYGKGLDITFAHNPALLGGLRVRVGSDVYDGSVAARLQQVEATF